MKQSNKITPNLEREILARLYPGSRKVTELVEEIAYIRKVSIQGVYKALRILKKEEVVTVYAHTVSLSLIWIAKERERLQFAEESYKSAQYIEEIRMGTRKQMKHTFHSLKEIDLFWTHAYVMLAEKLGNDVRTYSIQPHDWYMYVRTETDTFWIKRHRESNRVSRTVLTHPGALDRAVIRKRKEQLGNLFEYTLGVNPYMQNSCMYHNIIGPFIFTARFDANIAEKLNAFIESHDTLPLSKIAQAEIRDIVSAKGEFHLTIEHNEKKATTMRDKVKKYFEF